MPERNARVGKVSAIDYDNGMISVTYPDLDDNVTDYIPAFSHCDEYKMPNIGDEVLVIHRPNGYAQGVVMGKYWNKKNLPARTGKGVYRKELGESPGEAYIEYEGGTATICAGEIILSTTSGSISVSELIALSTQIAELQKRVSALESAI